MPAFAEVRVGDVLRVLRLPEDDDIMDMAEIRHFIEVGTYCEITFRDGTDNTVKVRFNKDGSLDEIYVRPEWCDKVNVSSDFLNGTKVFVKTGRLSGVPSEDGENQTPAQDPAINERYRGMVGEVRAYDDLDDAVEVLFDNGTLVWYFEVDLIPITETPERQRERTSTPRHVPQIPIGTRIRITGDIPELWAPEAEPDWDNISAREGEIIDYSASIAVDGLEYRVEVRGADGVEHFYWVPRSALVPVADEPEGSPDAFAVGSRVMLRDIPHPMARYGTDLHGVGRTRWNRNRGHTGVVSMPHPNSDTVFVRFEGTEDNLPIMKQFLVRSETGPFPTDQATSATDVEGFHIGDWVRIKTNGVTGRYGHVMRVVSVNTFGNVRLGLPTGDASAIEVPHALEHVADVFHTGGGYRPEANRDMDEIYAFFNTGDRVFFQPSGGTPRWESNASEYNTERLGWLIPTLPRSIFRNPYGSLIDARTDFKSLIYDKLGWPTPPEWGLGEVVMPAEVPPTPSSHNSPSLNRDGVWSGAIPLQVGDWVRTNSGAIGNVVLYNDGALKSRSDMHILLRTDGGTDGGNAGPQPNWAFGTSDVAEARRATGAPVETAPPARAPTTRTPSQTFNPGDTVRVIPTPPSDPSVAPTWDAQMNDWVGQTCTVVDYRDGHPRARCSIAGTQRTARFNEEWLSLVARAPSGSTTAAVAPAVAPTLTVPEMIDAIGVQMVAAGRLSSWHSGSVAFTGDGDGFYTHNHSPVVTDLHIVVATHLGFRDGNVMGENMGYNRLSSLGGSPQGQKTIVDAYWTELYNRVVGATTRPFVVGDMVILTTRTPDDYLGVGSDSWEEHFESRHVGTIAEFVERRSQPAAIITWPGGMRGPYALQYLALADATTAVEAHDRAYPPAKPAVKVSPGDPRLMNADNIISWAEDNLKGTKRSESSWDDKSNTYEQWVRDEVREQNRQIKRGWKNPFDKLRGERYTLPEVNLNVDAMAKNVENQQDLITWLEAVAPEKKYYPKPGDWTNVYIPGDDKPVPIGKLFDKYQAPKNVRDIPTLFADTPANEAVSVEITDDFKDVLTQSTGRPWATTTCDSCVRLGGAYEEGPFNDLAHNNGVAYFYKGAEKLPFARFILRWCENDNGEVDIGMEPQIYSAFPKDGKHPPYAFALSTGLSNLLKFKGFGNYEKCTTPYIHKGYSDMMKTEAGGTGATSDSPIVYTEPGNFTYLASKPLSYAVASMLAFASDDVRRVLVNNPTFCQWDKAVSMLVNNERDIDIINTLVGRCEAVTFSCAQADKLLLRDKPKASKMLAKAAVTGQKGRRKVKDEHGKNVKDPVLDADGNPVLDSKGKPKMADRTVETFDTKCACDLYMALAGSGDVEVRKRVAESEHMPTDCGCDTKLKLMADPDRSGVIQELAAHSLAKAVAHNDAPEACACKALSLIADSSDYMVTRNADLFQLPKSCALELAPKLAKHVEETSLPLYRSLVDMVKGPELSSPAKCQVMLGFLGSKDNDVRMSVFDLPEAPLECAPAIYKSGAFNDSPFVRAKVAAKKLEGPAGLAIAEELMHDNDIDVRAALAKSDLSEKLGVVRTLGADEAPIVRAELALNKTVDAEQRCSLALGIAEELDELPEIMFDSDVELLKGIPDGPVAMAKKVLLRQPLLDACSCDVLRKLRVDDSKGVTFMATRHPQYGKCFGKELVAPLNLDRLGASEKRALSSYKTSLEGEDISYTVGKAQLRSSYSNTLFRDYVGVNLADITPSGSPEVPKFETAQEARDWYGAYLFAPLGWTPAWEKPVDCPALFKTLGNMTIHTGEGDSWIAPPSGTSSSARLRELRQMFKCVGKDWDALGPWARDASLPLFPTLEEAKKWWLDNLITPAGLKAPWDDCSMDGMLYHQIGGSAHFQRTPQQRYQLRFEPYEKSIYDEVWKCAGLSRRDVMREFDQSGISPTFESEDAARTWWTDKVYTPLGWRSAAVGVGAPEPSPTAPITPPADAATRVLHVGDRVRVRPNIGSRFGVAGRIAAYNALGGTVSTVRNTQEGRILLSSTPDAETTSDGPLWQHGFQRLELEYLGPETPAAATHTPPNRMSTASDPLLDVDAVQNGTLPLLEGDWVRIRGGTYGNVVRYNNGEMVETPDIHPLWLLRRLDGGVDYGHDGPRPNHNFSLGDVLEARRAAPTFASVAPSTFNVGDRVRVLSTPENATYTDSGGTYTSFTRVHRGHIGEVLTVSEVIVVGSEPRYTLAGSGDAHYVTAWLDDAPTQRRFNVGDRVRVKYFTIPPQHDDEAHRDAWLPTMGHIYRITRVYESDIAADTFPYALDTDTGMLYRGTWLELADAPVTTTRLPEILAVGTRIRATQSNPHMVAGAIGTIREFDRSGNILPYLIQFDAGQHFYLAREHFEPDTTDTPPDPSTIFPGDRVVYRDREGNEFTYWVHNINRASQTWGGRRISQPAEFVAAAPVSGVVSVSSPGGLNYTPAVGEIVELLPFDYTGNQLADAERAIHPQIGAFGPVTNVVDAHNSGGAFQYIIFTSNRAGADVWAFPRWVRRVGTTATADDRLPQIGDLVRIIDTSDEGVIESIGPHDDDEGRNDIYTVRIPPTGSNSRLYTYEASDFFVTRRV